MKKNILFILAIFIISCTQDAEVNNEKYVPIEDAIGQEYTLNKGKTTIENFTMWSGEPNEVEPKPYEVTFDVEFTTIADTTWQSININVPALGIGDEIYVCRAVWCWACKLIINQPLFGVYCSCIVGPGFCYTEELDL